MSILQIFIDLPNIFHFDDTEILWQYNNSACNKKRMLTASNTSDSMFFLKTRQS